MENLIEELTKVNPANLSEEGLKLFNKIMEIIDRNEELEKQVVLVPEGATFLAIPKNMILKSKVQELSEKIDKEEKQKLKGTKGQDRYFVKQIYQAKRSAVQELLQEGDK